MRIGIVCYPTFGGSGVVASDLAHGLAERGHEVHLLSYERPARLAFHPRLHVHEVEVTAYPLHKYPPYTLALAARIAEVSRAHRLDVVNVHYAVPHGASALVARAILGEGARRFALITTCHGTDVSLAGGDPGFAPLIRWTLRHSEAVTAVSGWLARETRRLFRVPLPAVLPNFVDLTRFVPTPPPAGMMRVVHCSNFRPVKRPADVVTAFAQASRGLSARLDMVGDGPEAARARAEAVRLGVSGRVRFLGSQEAVEEVLRGASAYLLASESESFGLSALEAMACGVPVVAPRVGGLPEVVQHRRTGLLCPPGDVQAMGQALRRLLTDVDLGAKMALAARRRAADHFDWESGISRYENLYHRTIAGKRTHA